MDKNTTQYLSTMVQAKVMLSRGIISIKDYGKIEQKMADKYCLNSLSLYRLNDLINYPFRAIYMIPKKEVILDVGNENNREESTTS